jgi:shikimate kinase
VKRHIALTGFMAAGKSTIGKKLARRLNRRFYDLDEVIAKKHGPVAEIFEKLGEDAFRRFEFGELSQIIEGEEPAVVALGGGAVTYAPSLELLKKSAYRVFIKLSPTQLLTRIRRSKNVRPLLGKAPTASAVEALYAKRLPLYMQSDVIIEAAHMTPPRVVEAIIQQLNEDNL